MVPTKLKALKLREQVLMGLRLCSKEDKNGSLAPCLWSCFISHVLVPLNQHFSHTLLLLLWHSFSFINNGAAVLVSAAGNVLNTTVLDQRRSRLCKPTVATCLFFSYAVCSLCWCYRSWWWMAGSTPIWGPWLQAFLSFGAFFYVLCMFVCLFI